MNAVNPRFVRHPDSEQPGNHALGGARKAVQEPLREQMPDDAGQMALSFEPAAPAPSASRSEPAAAAELEDKPIAAYNPRSAPLAYGQDASNNQPPDTLPTSAISAAEITPAERLMRFAYGLGVPAATLVAPFSRPAKPRVKAVVETLLAGDRVTGMALRAGHFLVGGLKIPIAEADFAPAAKLAPLVETVFHGFTWLRDLAASAPVPQCAATAERVLGDWLAANPHFGEEARDTFGKGAVWSVENASRRLFAWLVHAPLILSGPDKAFRADVLEAIGLTARWLDRNAGKAEDRQGEALAWAALAAAGLLLPEGKPRRLLAEAKLERALPAMMGEEGGVLSRSPLAQAEAIAVLVDLLACYRATRRAPPAVLEATLQALLPPLMMLAHADGTLGNWQGAGGLPAARVEALVRAVGLRTRPLREARQWGYQRMEAGEAVLVCDAAPPPLPRDARHGCASTLAFEFSHGDHALIVNCGGAALAGGQVPMRLEQGLRATAAHSTLVLGDANSTAVLLAGKLGKGVSEVDVDRGPATLDTTGESANGKGRGATRLEMGHDGYAARYGLVHRRVLMLSDEGTVLAGEDMLEPSGRKGQRGKVAYALRFHLAPQVDARLAPDARSADLVLPDGGFWRFCAGEERLTVEESIWVDGDGRPREAQQLVIEGLASRGGCGFAWQLRKMA